MNNINRADLNVTKLIEKSLEKEIKRRDISEFMESLR